MITFFALFALLLLAVLGVAAIAVASGASVRLKTAALAMTGLAVGLGYYAGTELLGRAKPVRLSLLERATGSAVLVGSTYQEGRAIYLWMVFPGETAPRAYVLPWSKDVAEALLKAQATAEANGTQVEVQSPFQAREGLADSLFDVPPPPPSPRKSGS